MLTYEFDYNLPFDNDEMGLGDVMVPVTATLLPTCDGMKPVVMLEFRNVYVSNLQRIIDFKAAVRDMEAIAQHHFADITGDAPWVIKIAS